MSSIFVLGLLAVSLGAEATSNPAKIKLTSRKITSARSSSSSQKRGSLPASVPLADFFRGTDLQRFGNISVGTPPQVLTVVFDTGSSTLEVCTQCGDACSNQIQFNSSKSLTFEDGGNTTTISFSTGVGVDPVESDDNYKLTLRSGRDVVSVCDLDAGQVSLFTITDQIPKFNVDPFSSIQGMSSQAQGFFAALVKKGLPAIFSLYLTPQSTGNAELTVGGIDNSEVKGDLVYSSLVENTRFQAEWSLTSPKIFVNHETTSTLQASRSILFDSGTSNVSFDTQTTEAIYSMISPNIKPHAYEPGAYGIACSKISSLPAKINITFTSTNFNLTIPSSELNVGPFANDASMCQTLINAFDGLSLVGGSLMKHYYSVFDVGQQRMGFAANDIFHFRAFSGG